MQLKFTTLVQFISFTIAVASATVVTSRQENTASKVAAITPVGGIPDPNKTSVRSLPLYFSIDAEYLHRLTPLAYWL
jgi:hypothetical protein